MSADAIEFLPDAANPRMPTADTRPETGFLENFRAAARENDLAGQTNSEALLFQDSYAPMLEAINRQRQAEGMPALENPGAWGSGAMGTHGRRSSQVDNGFDVARIFDRRVTRDEQENIIFGELARIRRRDGKFLQGVASTPAEFRKGFTDRASADLARAQDVQSRRSWAGTFGGFLGGAKSSFDDPLTVAGMFLGGGGGSLAKVTLREMAWNGANQLALEPSIGANYKRLGQDYTFTQAAADVFTAAVAGGFIEGGVHLGVKGGKALADRGGFGSLDRRLGRLLEGASIDDAAFLDVTLRRAVDGMPDADLIPIVDALTPAIARTPAQADALHIVEREAGIAATSPYRDTLAGLDLHAEKVEAHVQRLERGDRAAGPAIVGDGAGQLMARIRRAESSGNDAAQARTSSAFGRYQFLKSTWLTYYHRAFGATGETEAQILAKRADGATQDRLMGMLTADNARMLGRAGVPETAGNLYLAHFAGPSDAVKLHRADPSAPASSVMRAAAIRANPFLKNMSVGDVIDWAHRKMGETALGGDRAALRGDLFGDDLDGMAAAQRAIDAAEMDRLRLDAEGRSSTDIAAPNFRAAEDDLELQPIELDPADLAELPPIEAVSRETSALDAPQLQREPAEIGPRFDDVDAGDWPAVVDRMLEEKTGEVPAALSHPEIGPIDVIWGKAGTNRSDGYGLAKIVRYHPEVIEDLPAILAGMEVTSRTKTRVQLETANHKAAVRLDWDGKAKSWLLTAFEKNAPSGAVDRRAPDLPGPDGSPDRGAPRDIAQTTPDRNAAVAPDPSAQYSLALFDDPRGEAVTVQTESLAHDAAMLDQAMLVDIGDGSAPRQLGDLLAELEETDAALATVQACMVPLRKVAP